MDYSLPDSSVHGIFQARGLEWVTIAFSISERKSYFSQHEKRAKDPTLKMIQVFEKHHLRQKVQKFQKPWGESKLWPV